MNKLIILGLFFTLMFGIIPQHYEFDNEGLRSLENSEDWSLPYNSVRDIYQGYENKLFFGTSGGLGYAFISQLDNIQFGTFINESLPQGGNPALITKEDVIAVSGSGLVEHSGGYYPAGTGIGYSINNGESWSYKVQPVDSIPINGHFQTFSWGGQELNQLAVTTEINNITYDLAIVRDYIYSTSWAGGLRRFQFQNFNPAMPDEDPNPWEIIPIPMDNQSTLQCGLIDAENFELNPAKFPNKLLLADMYNVKPDPGLSGNDAHNQYLLNPNEFACGYNQASNNKKNWDTPCDGTAYPPSICGGLYKKKHFTNLVDV